MSDFALIWDGIHADLDVDVGLLADFAEGLPADYTSDEGLETAVSLSLFTDRSAEEGDTLPPGQTDKRGSWMDAVPVVPGDRGGSRLWLLSAAKQTRDTLTKAEFYAREALQWMLDDKVTDKIDVVASVPRSGVLGLVITINRPSVGVTSYRYNYTWAAQEGA